VGYSLENASYKALPSLLEKGFGASVIGRLKREYIEYKWMGRGMKIPLLKVTDNLLGLVVQYIDSVRDLTTDIGRHELLKPLLCYPNPNPGILKVQLGNPVQGVSELSIYDMRGKVVYKQKLPDASQGTITVDMAGLSVIPGQYIVELATATSRIRQKIIYTP